MSEDCEETGQRFDEQGKLSDTRIFSVSDFSENDTKEFVTDQAIEKFEVDAASDATDKDDFAIAGQEKQDDVKNVWMTCEDRLKYGEVNPLPFTGKLAGAFIRNVEWPPVEIVLPSRGRPSKLRNKILDPPEQFIPNPLIKGKGAFEVFMLYFQQIMEVIICQSNKYLRTTRPAGHQASDGDQDEISSYLMMRFFALVISMGHTEKDSLSEYWSTNVINCIPFFGNTLKEETFFHILQNLHFTDKPSTEEKLTDNSDGLWELRDIVNMVREKSQEFYNPTRQLAIDSVVVASDGQLPFRSYISSSSERKKDWMKIYKMCDDFSYTWNLKVCTASEDIILNGETLAERTVKDLVVGLENTGHHLFMDVFFTSPRVYRNLKANGILACGPLRANHADMPSEFKKQERNQLELKHQELACRVTSDGLTCVLYHDKEYYTILSTIHGPINEGHCLVTIDGEEKVTEPPVMRDYVKHMSSVDLCDQQIIGNSLLRRTGTWSKRLFFHLFDILLANACVAYCSVNKVDRRNRYRWFREEVIGGFLVASSTSGPLRQNFTRGLHSDRLNGRHFPDEQIGGKRCILCIRNGVRKETMFRCETCPGGPALCIVPCFQIYHSEEVL